MKHLLLLTLALLAVTTQGQRNCFSKFSAFDRNAAKSIQSPNIFGLNLLKGIANSTDSSVFISPYGAWSALLLAYLGSEQETKRQLSNVLGIGADTGTVNNYRVLLNNELTKNLDPNTKVRALNRAYFDDNLRLDPCVLNVIVDTQTVDFQKPQEAAKTINGDVDKVTDGLIKEIVSPGALQRADMVLLNSLYFKGTWKTKFDPKRTIDVIFTDEFQKQNISFGPMMVMPGGQLRYTYSDELDAHVVEIPYTGDRYSMYGILSDPTKGSTSGTVLNKLSDNLIETIIPTMSRSTVDLAFPKFKMSTHYDEDMKKVLIDMGLFDLFTPRANLKGFAPSENLFIGDIIQKNVIENDETGSKAASATALISTRIGGPVPRKQLVFSRPFVFFIRDNKTKTILFMGVYRHPKDTERL